LIYDPLYAIITLVSLERVSHRYHFLGNIHIIKRRCTELVDNKKLFVGNLPWGLTNDSLRDLFSQVGEVVEAIVITDRMSGRSKGFGFVTFATEEAATAAVQQLNEKEVEGRKIIVNVARPREERAPGDRGGFRNDHRRSY